MSTTLSLLFFFIIAGIAIWLSKKIFGWKLFSKKKSSSTPAPLPSNIANDKTAKTKDSEIQNLSTNQLKIFIFRSISDGLVAQVGDPIIATEKKDSNNTLLAINEEANFKEDFNFSVDRVYEIMNFSLKMQNKTKKEKAVILEKKIKNQEELILSIDDDVKLNERYNYRDEELKLRQLKVFYNSLRKESTGNYMRLGKGGIRQFEFVVIDGILYPYFFGGKWFRVYPDLLVKKKIFNHENTVFKNETAALQKSIFGWINVITLIIGLVMIAIGGGMMSHAYSKNSEVTIDANKGAITCTNTLATMNTAYGGIVSEYLNIKRAEAESIKKSENPINNIPSVSSIINVDPTQITR